MPKDGGCFVLEYLSIFFNLPQAGGPTAYDEELLTIFVQVWYLFTLQKEVGGGRAGCVRHS